MFLAKNTNIHFRMQSPLLISCQNPSGIFDHLFAFCLAFLLSLRGSPRLREVDGDAVSEYTRHMVKRIPITLGVCRVHGLEDTAEEV